MLSRVADFLIALLELLEAEAKHLKEGLLRTGTTLTLVVVGVVLLGAAAAVLGWAGYLVLLPYLGRAGAAACYAATLALLGGIFLWTAKSRRNKS